MNLVFIMLMLMILGCHNVVMSNPFDFVLGYLLLQGYDVTGEEYILRIASLLIGMIICMAVFYKNQKNRPYRRTFLDLFEFNLRSARRLQLVCTPDCNCFCCVTNYVIIRITTCNVGRNCLYVPSACHFQ